MWASAGSRSSGTFLSSRAISIRFSPSSGDQSSPHSLRLSIAGSIAACVEVEFDALWLHGYWSLNSLAAMAAAKTLGIPVLQRTDGTLIDRPRSRAKRVVKRMFFSSLRRFVHAVLPVGRMNQEYWAHYLGPEFPMFLMPYAVDNSYFQSKSATAHRSREEFRRELGLGPARPVILYASKLMDRKRCIDLIDAFLGMRSIAQNKRPYLLIAGDGSERSACEARVRAANEPNVHFLGFQNQSQLARLFDLCDMFVLPSVHEPFGLVVNEVMNAGKAVVVSDEVGCQPDLVIDGVNGRVFPARNVAALRAVLEHLVAEPEALRQMGLRSLERINQWSFEEDIRCLRAALHHVAGLPLTPPAQTAESLNAASTINLGQEAQPQVV